MENDVKLRLVRLMESPFRVFSEESFDDPRNEPEIMAPIPGYIKFLKDREKVHRSRDDAPHELKPLYEEPLLTREQEYHLFRQFNFLKHKALRLLQRADVLAPNKTEVETVEKLLGLASNVKRQIVCSNLRLVMNLAKKSKEFIANPNIDLLAELVSDGNMGMCRAVEYFDYRLGNKFSTYATWAILHTMKNGRQSRMKHAQNCVSGYDDVLEAKVDESEQPEITEVTPVQRAMEELDPRQRAIIVEAFGLDGKPKRTLAKIGEKLGITKERVRQIREKGLSVLREKLVHVKN
jgi:RNA polymerase sigma factor (sigma-70 family)